MDRRKLQQRFRILIFLQQIHRIKQQNQKKKKSCLVSETFSKTENVKLSVLDRSETHP